MSTAIVTISAVNNSTPKIDRATSRACKIFDECRAAGKLTLEALIPAREAYKKYKLNREQIDKCLDVLYDYADNFFDQDYPKGTFSYSSQMPNT